MSQRGKAAVSRDSAAEQEMRDQEVLRANTELAAYFSGQRTEREARAALKVIKAFVRRRGRLDAKSRPPLPAVQAAKTPKAVANGKAASDRRPRRTPKPRRARHQRQSTRATAAIEQPLNPEPSPPLASDERTRE